MDMKVRVEGESGSKHSITKDMKSLSGGERSFITVCFMLAVAQVISSPFHCMDEFDVFMDAINRRVRLTSVWPHTPSHTCMLGRSPFFSWGLLLTSVCSYDDTLYQHLCLGLIVCCWEGALSCRVQLVNAIFDV